ncbi:MAG TPA: glycosyltransferase [Gemmatimonadaceae bacterium]|nr:glycosyltransferase [Gemmatimonadaceae bacterium]
MSSLRVAFVAGTLGQGGAEKQLVYMATALHRAGVDVRIFSLTRGEFYEGALRTAGLEPTWIGRTSLPPARIGILAAAMAPSRPHIIQSGHFYANGYVALTAPLVGAMSIGAVRNDAHFDVGANGRWGRWLLRAPETLICNSETAKRNAEELGRSSADMRVVSNVIDLAELPRPAERASSDPVVVITTCRLVAQKRVDRLLHAVGAVRRAGMEIELRIAGEGPERPALERLAGELHLPPDVVRFLGRRDDVASELRRASIFALTSDHEGFPNVVLEAMAAGLPVVTTDAGDAGVAVVDDETGYVVRVGDDGALLERLTRLVRSPELRRTMGQAGRLRVERMYGLETLSATLLETYRSLATGRHRRGVLRALDA